MTAAAQILLGALDAPFSERLLRTLLFRSGFNTTLVVAGTTLLGLAAGVVGVFALLRKRSLVTDAIGHATLPGIAIAFLAGGAVGGGGRSLPWLLAGATIAGIAGVLCIQGILRATRLREDAAIAIVLSVFFGAGVVLLSVIQSHAAAGSAGLMRFIYGQAASMSPSDVALMAGVAGSAIAVALLLRKELAIVCFNDAFARVVGWPVGLIDLALMGLVIGVTIAGIQAVGLILVVALLVVPAVAASFWTERLGSLIALGGAFGAASGHIGAVISSLAPRQPAGAIIVLVAGAIFLLSLIAAPRRGVVAEATRRMRMRVRIAGEHLLEEAARHGGATLPPAALDALARLRGWSPLLRRVVVVALRRGGFVGRLGSAGLPITPSGLERGVRIARNHALWTRYLTSSADVAASHVDWSVDVVEHVLSEELVAELERELAASSGSHGGQRS